MPPPSVFLCSITGSQGKPLALQLRRLGWTVKGTSRTPDSNAARQLKAAGVELSKGDWDDVASLTAAMSGVEKIFISTITYADDPDRERRQGLNIVAAAKAAKVQQVALSGSLGVVTLGDPTLSPFFKMVITGKRVIEQAIEDGPFKHWTFIRPAFFMNNLLTPQVDYFLPHLRQENVWETVMREGERLALADPDDISKLVVVIFQNPEKWHGRGIPFASELLSVPDMLEQLGEATGTEFEEYFMTDEDIDSQAVSFSFMMSDRVMRKQAEYMDMEELSSAIQLTSFSEWLEKEKETVLETYC
uniref:NmrA-like domain-containing protein n=1 Tax=Bionectria ochroleuca TaxID=29856 RepID=A0A8H7K9P4_BIOOC